MVKLPVNITDCVSNRRLCNTWFDIITLTVSQIVVCATLVSIS